MVNRIILFGLIIFLLSGLALSFHEESSVKRKMQESTFRLIVSIAYRNAQYPTAWCIETKMSEGRPYDWSEFRAYSINLLDLYIGLQFDVACESQLLHLREVLSNQTIQPPAFQNSSTWWEDTFLKSAVDAFTCGFTGSKIEDFEFVSHDLRDNFNSDLFKQKLWYLVEDYMISIYKQRENNNRRLDFDAGLYIPFLDNYTPSKYTILQQLRVGFPTFIGRAIWFVFHAIGQRISDSTCSDQTAQDNLFEIVQNWMGYFPTNHPCPFCREHFISHVAVNDRYSSSAMTSESIRFYPIEHLLMGGIEGTLASKLSVIKSSDKNSLAIFFWKIHNAVTSAVEMGCSCFTEELLDVDAFRCVYNSALPQQTRYPRMGRVFPTSKRFEFILTDDHNYTLFDESREQLQQVYTNITILDTLSLRIELWNYWNNGAALSQSSLDQINQLNSEIDKMTNIFIQLPILSKEYSHNETLSCDKLSSYVADVKSKQLLAAPNLQISKLPQICNSFLIESACVLQYPTPSPNITKNPIENENSTLSQDSSGSKIIILNYIALLLLVLILNF